VSLFIPLGLHNVLNVGSGKRYLAHKTPHLTWTCQLNVKSRELWEQWRASVYGKAISLFFVNQSFMTTLSLLQRSLFVLAGSIS